MALTLGRRRRTSAHQRLLPHPRCMQLVVPKSRLLHVNAYTPGDFKQFFADPRTRADYLQWAPYLLEAEEYHAGHRRVGEAVRHSDEYRG